MRRRRSRARRRSRSPGCGAARWPPAPARRPRAAPATAAARPSSPGAGPARPPGRRPRPRPSAPGPTAHCCLPAQVQQRGQRLGQLRSALRSICAISSLPSAAAGPATDRAARWSPARRRGAVPGRPRPRHGGLVARASSARVCVSARSFSSQCRSRLSRRCTDSCDRSLLSVSSASWSSAAAWRDSACSKRLHLVGHLRAALHRLDELLVGIGA